MDVDIDSDAGDSAKQDLLLAAQNGCFVEQSLKPGLVKHRLKTAGGWIDV